METFKRALLRAYHRIALHIYRKSLYFAASHMGLYTLAEEQELWRKLNHHADRVRDLSPTKNKLTKSRSRIGLT